MRCIRGRILFEGAFYSRARSFKKILDGSTSMRSKHCLITYTTDIGKDRQ